MAEPPIVKDPTAKVFNLDDVLTFGKKWKGVKVAQVAKEDPGFILWAQNTVSWAIFTPEVLALCTEPVARAEFTISLEAMIEHRQSLFMLYEGVHVQGGIDGLRKLYEIHPTATLQNALRFFLDLSDNISDAIRLGGRAIITTTE